MQLCDLVPYKCFIYPFARSNICMFTQKLYFCFLIYCAYTLRTLYHSFCIYMRGPRYVLYFKKEVSIVSFLFLSSSFSLSLFSSFPSFFPLSLLISVIQKVVAQLAGQPIQSKEPPKSVIQNLFFYGRCIMSLAILCFSFAVTMTALFNGQTTMWEGVPSTLAVVLFFVFMAIVGMLEGMQIAFFAVAKMTEEERAKSTWAKRTCDVLFQGDGRNLPGFMVGRQMVSGQSRPVHGMHLGRHVDQRSKRLTFCCPNIFCSV